MSTEMSAPCSLDLNGNVSDNWRKFLQRFKIYILATEKDQKPVAQQTAIFLHVAGEEAMEVYNTFTFGENEDRMNLEHVIDKFTNYCTPRKKCSVRKIPILLKSIIIRRGDRALCH